MRSSEYSESGDAEGLDNINRTWSNSFEQEAPDLAEEFTHSEEETASPKGKAFEVQGTTIVNPNTPMNNLVDDNMNLKEKINSLGLPVPTDVTNTVCPTQFVSSEDEALEKKDGSGNVITEEVKESQEIDMPQFHDKAQIKQLDGSIPNSGLQNSRPQSKHEDEVLDKNLDILEEIEGSTVDVPEQAGGCTEHTEESNDLNQYVMEAGEKEEVESEKKQDSAIVIMHEIDCNKESKQERQNVQENIEDVEKELLNNPKQGDDESEVTAHEEYTFFDYNSISRPLANIMCATSGDKDVQQLSFSAEEQKDNEDETAVDESVNECVLDDVTEEDDCGKIELSEEVENEGTHQSGNSATPGGVTSLYDAETAMAIPSTKGLSEGIVDLEEITAREDIESVDSEYTEQTISDAEIEEPIPNGNGLNVV